MKRGETDLRNESSDTQQNGRPGQLSVCFASVPEQMMAPFINSGSSGKRAYLKESTYPKRLTFSDTCDMSAA